MAEYINREDALEFPFANGIYDHEHANEHFISGCESYREWIEQIPAADVVEVVRCKDCRWFVPSAYDDCWCSAKEAGITKGMCTPGGNDYCSDGERRQ